MVSFLATILGSQLTTVWESEGVLPGRYLILSSLLLYLSVLSGTTSGQEKFVGRWITLRRRSSKLLLAAFLCAGIVHGLTTPASHHPRGNWREEVEAFQADSAHIFPAGPGPWSFQLGDWEPQVRSIGSDNGSGLRLTVSTPSLGGELSIAVMSGSPHSAGVVVLREGTLKTATRSDGAVILDPSDTSGNELRIPFQLDAEGNWKMVLQLNAALVNIGREYVLQCWSPDATGLVSEIRVVRLGR
jgi:hypothetical protein